MTARKSKAQRLLRSRLSRAKALAGIDPTDPLAAPPPGAVMADHHELRHNNTYSPFPRFYVDRVVVCRRCGTEEVWPAERQKWWYEVAKGNIDTRAVLCRSCREQRKQERDAARARHLDGLKNKRQDP